MTSAAGILGAVLLLQLDLVAAVEVEKVYDLKLAIVVFRHGDRSALYSYPTDPYGEGIWPDGFGQLTKKGVKQLYNLGQFLRKRYDLLLGNKITNKHVRLESSGMARTLQSAASLAAGMFPPPSDRVWDTTELGKNWFPLPVYSRDINRDAVFGVSPCPEFQRLKYHLDDLVETELLRPAYKTFTEYILNHTSMTAFNFPKSFNMLYDILNCQTQHGYPLPDWITEDTMEKITRLAHISFQMSMGGNARDNKDRIRFRGGGNLRDIMNRIIRKVNGSSVDEEVQVFLYSAHDENIGSLLAALKMYNSNLADNRIGIPNYGSALFFELFSNDTVRISFKNDRPEDSASNPRVMKHPDCTEFCPAKTLNELARPYFMEDEEFFTRCQPTHPPPPAQASALEQSDDEAGTSYSTKLGVGIAVLVSIFIGIVLILFWVIRSSRKSRRHKLRLVEEERESGMFMDRDPLEKHDGSGQRV